MSLPLNLSDIHFGERDALHEFTKQDRQNITILDNSFVVPPRVKMSDLESGARFLIVGPKGSGKTTLLWHLKRKMGDHRSKIILFKSDIRKEDRDRLDRMTDIVIVEDQNRFSVEADYKTIWEWYLLKNIFTIVHPDDVCQGIDIYEDIRKLLDIKENRLNTIYDNFHVQTVKGKILLSAGSKNLRSELSAEVEARRSDKEMEFLDLIRLIQDSIGKIKLKDSSIVRLFVDELEFFMSEYGDGERDRRLVRDLVFSIDYINSLFGRAGMDVVILASIRSEILNSFTSNSQEVDKIVDAYGVKLNWYHDNLENHRVLNIFENKIKYSEIDMAGEYSSDVWDAYFPKNVKGQNVRSYLLDQGLHRPRGVLLRIKAALELEDESNHFTEDSFLKSEDIFGGYMLQEFSEEISASYNETEKDEILSIFRGFSYAFDKKEIERRINLMTQRNKKAIIGKIKTEQLIRYMYRIGMIGNQFDLKTEDGKILKRNLWSFRGEPNPAIDKRFILHKSVRKVMQTV
ncbi:hypothetical protein TSH58p_07135 [Azospirillum sp. TSH58]|uniref:ATP-binding cassette domain-containing protein n=1 Tax=Azospirillum sp. TSH58 TaxID=664962 RepID=UPI000D602C21|nr:ATP-binding cassette domain-containing protein [Azospirillum sp. TSH58]AWJ85258.1 hypothetical protein TSH58p_07135 [Azospirillum sp. TSH58]